MGYNVLPPPVSAETVLETTKAKILEFGTLAEAAKIAGKSPAAMTRLFKSHGYVPVDVARAWASAFKLNLYYMTTGVGDIVEEMPEEDDQQDADLYEDFLQEHYAAQVLRERVRDLEGALRIHGIDVAPWNEDEAAKAARAAAAKQ